MYDDRAASFVAAIDNLLSAKAKSASRELGALLNALEVHIEDGEGHPDIVKGFQRLFADLAHRRAVNQRVIDAAMKHFNSLVQYLFQQTAGQ